MSNLDIRSVTGPFGLAVMALFLSGLPAKAAIIYQVTVDTTAINGTAGNLDFSFSPGDASSQAAFVTISSFSSTGGVLGGAPSIIGGVTGTLPGTVTIDNSAPFNDYFQPFTYGTSFQFLLTLDGIAITSPNGTALSGSTFILGLFDATGANALLTTEPNGFAGEAFVNLNGTVTTAVFPSTVAGGPPAVTFAPTVVTPEPSTLSFVGGSLLLIAGASARRRSKALLSTNRY